MSHESFRFGKDRNNIFSGLDFGSIELEVMSENKVFVSAFIFGKGEFFPEPRRYILFGIIVELFLVGHLRAHD